MNKKAYERMAAIYTTEGVAQFLRVHVSSVREWSKRGKLRGFKVGYRGKWRYQGADVLKFLYEPYDKKQ